MQSLRSFTYVKGEAWQTQDKSGKQILITMLYTQRVNNINVNSYGNKKRYLKISGVWELNEDFGGMEIN